MRVADPVRGAWLVDPDGELTVWTDASQTAMGVVTECAGNVIQDAAWLRSSNDLSHINRSELEAVIKGLTLALRWKRRQMTIVTDSATVAGWLRAVIEKRQNVKTKALEEVLIRRRLNTLSEIIAVENLCLTVRLVKSAENLADRLTRIPTDCQVKVDTTRHSPVPGLAATFTDVKMVHDVCHFGVDRTLELAREKHGISVSKRLARRVVSRCQVCARIDPASVRYEHGHIRNSRCWDRLAVDVTHFDHIPYLSVIDVASKFTIWRALRNESADEVVKNMRSIFSEFGPPRTILSDNSASFRAAPMHDLLQRWDVSHELSSAYRPQGNSVVERVHRTVKRVARRGSKTVDEAVFWVNNTRGNKSYTPYEIVFSASSRKPGISEYRVDCDRPVLSGEDDDESYYDTDRNPFAVGDLVYLRPPSGRCDELWTGPHRVTGVKSRVSVELDADGVARHISHIRLVPGMCEASENGFPVRVEDSDQDDVDCLPLERNDVDVDAIMTKERDPEPCVSQQPQLSPGKPHADAPSDTRRSCRERRPPFWHEDYYMS
jgi:ribonuclease HI